MKLAELRKEAIALGGFVGACGSSGLFHGTVLRIAGLVVAGLVAVGVYLTPNSKPAPTPGAKP